VLGCSSKSPTTSTTCVIVGRCWKSRFPETASRASGTEMLGKRFDPGQPVSQRTMRPRSTGSASGAATTPSTATLRSAGRCWCARAATRGAAPAGRRPTGPPVSSASSGRRQHFLGDARPRVGERDRAAIGAGGRVGRGVRIDRLHARGRGGPAAGGVEGQRRCHERRGGAAPELARALRARHERERRPDGDHHRVAGFPDDGVPHAWAPRRQRRAPGWGACWKGSGTRAGRCTCGTATTIRRRGSSRSRTRSGSRGGSTCMGLRRGIRFRMMIHTVSALRKLSSDTLRAAVGGVKIGTCSLDRDPPGGDRVHRLAVDVPRYPGGVSVQMKGEAIPSECT
jgi:hypothetical protein